MALKGWTVRSLHRWFGVVVGVAFALWVFSGIVMVSGISPTPNGISLTPPGPGSDLSRAVISPSQAVARVAQVRDPEEGVRVRHISFRTVGTRRVYDLLVGNGETILVDVESGDILQVDLEMARDLARRWMRSDLRISREEVVEAYDQWYVRGSLPVFRFVFDNGTRVHVQPSTGDVALADRGVQVFYGILGLHTFSIFASLFRIGLGRWLLWAASAGSIVVILTGYFMAYPRLRFRNRRRAESAGRSMTSV